MECAACSARIEAGERRCRYCGTEVVPAAGTPVAPKAETVSGTYCPSCGRVFTTGEADCPRCAAAGTPIRGGKCPRCDRPMFTYEVDGATIDECEGCGGIWFDRNEIQKVVDLSGEFESSPAAAATPAPEALRTPVEREEARTCVRCLGRMDRGPIAPGSDAVADFCPRHGLWLDRGAIERLRAFAASGGLGRAGIPLQRATRRPGAWRRHDLSGQGGFPPGLALSLLGDAYLGYLAVKHPYRRATGRRRRP